MMHGRVSHGLQWICSSVVSERISVFVGENICFVGEDMTFDKKVHRRSKMHGFQIASQKVRRLRCIVRRTITDPIK